MRASFQSVAAISVLAAVNGAAAAAALTAPDVELVRPAAGEALAGGTLAIVEWEPRGRLDPGIEEWEAFLSFNGGDYYAVRITPHLDVSRRSFTFEVPDLPTGDARILLRFGDEKQEVGVEVPHTFSVRRGPLPRAGRGLPTLDRGEPARPGEPGVVAWVEGSRQGRGLARFESTPPRCTGASVSPGPAEADSVMTRRTDSPALTRAANQALAETARPGSEANDLPRPPARILLLACRQNE